MAERSPLSTNPRESGQAIVVLVLALVSLMGFAGFVIDIGYAYYTKRALQATADAAALAGAQELPDGGPAATRAREYGTSGKNALTNVGSVTEQVTTKCISSVPGCAPVNAVVVTETATPPTFLSRVFGIDTFTVSAKATACSPCGVKPLDVMLVLDRTLSMCMTHSGGMDPSCTDLNNAREGMLTFLSLLDAERQWVGLAVFPPATTMGNRCATPSNNNYNSTSAAYTVVRLTNDYAQEDGTINPGSNLVSTINCQRGGGFTAYANALEKAQAELNARGRPDVQDVIVFFSDGAANVGPSYYPSSSTYRRQPCHQGVWSAGTIKATGTLIYSIGYDLDAEDGGANVCRAGSPFAAPESPSITAYEALQQIATSAGHFFNQPGPGDLQAAYTSIARDIRRGTAALVDDEMS